VTTAWSMRDRTSETLYQLRRPGPRSEWPVNVDSGLAERLEGMKEVKSYAQRLASELVRDFEAEVVVLQAMPLTEMCPRSSQWIRWRNARAATGVVDAALVRLQHFDQHAHHGTGRIELATPLNVRRRIRGACASASLKPRHVELGVRHGQRIRGGWSGSSGRWNYSRQQASEARAPRPH